jgi:hypothetical protein
VGDSNKLDYASPESKPTGTPRRVTSIAIIAVGVFWGVDAAIQSQRGDPPGLILGIPAIVLLLVGGAIWPSNKKHQRR